MISTTTAAAASFTQFTAENGRDHAPESSTARALQYINQFKNHIMNTSSNYASQLIHNMNHYYDDDDAQIAAMELLR